MTVKPKSTGRPNNTCISAAVTRLIESSVPFTPHSTSFHGPTTKTKFCEIAFSIADPTVWNTAPESVMKAPSVDSFKQHLEAYYFKLSPVHSDTTQLDAELSYVAMYRALLRPTSNFFLYFTFSSFLSLCNMPSSSSLL